MHISYYAFIYSEETIDYNTLHSSIKASHSKLQLVCLLPDYFVQLLLL